MKLTVRQLQLHMEEQLDKMTIRTERAELHYSELHDRIDRILLGFERLQTDVRELSAGLNNFEQNLSILQQELFGLLPVLDQTFTAVEHRQGEAEQRLDRLKTR